jgi:NitT/TauT family transport system permease protein
VMRRHERLIVAAAILGLLALWEALVRLGQIDPSLAPAPSMVADSLIRLAGRPEVRASLGVTAWEVLAAFLIALPAGLLLGFLLAEVPLLGALFRPLVNFLFGVPKSIFLPVFILVFGVSIPQKIAFGVFTTVFVLIVGGVAAVQSVPPELITVSRVYGATRGQIIREIYLPAMAPILLESARLAMVFNITAVLLCEIYGARDGIGYRIAAWGENLQMPQLYAALAIVAAAAVAVNEALRAVESRLGAWRQRP